MKKVTLLSKRVRVVSSVVSDIEYNYQYKTLKVKLNSGARYKYKGVPTQTFINFSSSPSKGRYYNKWIVNQDKYPCQRII